MLVRVDDREARAEHPAIGSMSRTASDRRHSPRPARQTTLPAFWRRRIRHRDAHDGMARRRSGASLPRLGAWVPVRDPARTSATADARSDELSPDPDRWWAPGRDRPRAADGVLGRHDREHRSALGSAGIGGVRWRPPL